MKSTVAIHCPSSTKPIIAGYCASFFSRLRGYMFTRTIGPHEGLLLVEKQENRMDTSIHMFFMSFDLAVVWIDRQGKVVDKCLAKRWRPYYASSRPALMVLETHPDRLSDFHIGDQLIIEPC